MRYDRSYSGASSAMIIMTRTSIVHPLASCCESNKGAEACLPEIPRIPIGMPGCQVSQVGIILIAKEQAVGGTYSYAVHS